MTAATTLARRALADTLRQAGLPASAEVPTVPDAALCLVLPSRRRWIGEQASFTSRELHLDVHLVIPPTVPAETALCRLEDMAEALLGTTLPVIGIDPPELVEASGQPWGWRAVARLAPLVMPEPTTEVTP